MTHDPQRRLLLATLLASMAPHAITADSILLCPTDPAISNKDAALTIDTHTHIFNGSDLQIKEFLSQTTVGPGSELYPLVNAMSGVLQVVAWQHAPTAVQERAAIKKYAARLGECEGYSQIQKLAAAALQEQYTIGKRELQLAATAYQPAPSSSAILGPKDGLEGLGAAIAGMPQTLKEFDGEDAPSVLQTQPTLAGYIRFVLHHFNYRHCNAIDYLVTYSKETTRKVDLAVASMVDYDYWLAKGRPTSTALKDQVELMSEITVLLGGRVHGFVPFCPFRETMTLDRSGLGDSMRLVKSAVEQNGFIGVKIYPPMGFAAWGNTGRSEWRDKPSIDSVAWQPDFGKRLDQAMQSLFNYCLENDVPIMAHTNDSNGPYEDFRKLAGSDYWNLALKKFPGLSVNFGHFGDSDLEDRNGADTLPFVKLMSAAKNSSGANAFADSGFFAGAMIHQGKMRDTLLSLYDAESGIMRERLMYGTDWSMILTQKNVKHYLSNFIQLMTRVERARPGTLVRNSSISNAFFGGNAAQFLGLRSNRGNRKRLDLFYAKNAVPTPDWLRKVDRL